MRCAAGFLIALSCGAALPRAASAQAPVAALPPPALAAAAAPVQTPAEALIADAGEYARHYAVTLAEAIARLAAQQASVAATDRIAAVYADRLAGIVIEHRPAYRIVVLLTGTAAVPDETIVAGSLIVPVTYRTGAPATRDETRAAIAAHQAEIGAGLDAPPGLAVDPRDGGLIVLVNASDAVRLGTARIAGEVTALTGIPARIVVPGRGDADFAATGGGRLIHVDPLTRRWTACTSGFVVTDGARTGLITAAHCPDELDTVAADGRRTPLRFVGQWGARYQDVQVNASATPLPPLFHAGSVAGTLRTVATWRNRGSTRAGDFVCHQGERTGYTCAEVVWPDYAPPGDLCGGPCTPDWVVVDGPGCNHGDSGGPVFSGSIAFGILKGGSYRSDGTCNFYYYMSTDYLPAGWSLLRGEANAAPPISGNLAPAPPVAAPIGRVR